MDAGLARCYDLAQDYTLPRYFKTIEARRQFVAGSFALCEEFDVLVTPTMPLTAFSAEAEVPEGGEANAAAMGDLDALHLSFQPVGPAGDLDSRRNDRRSAGWPANRWRLGLRRSGAGICKGLRSGARARRHNHPATGGRLRADSRLAGRNRPRPGAPAIHTIGQRDTGCTFERLSSCGASSRQCARTSSRSMVVSSRPSIRILPSTITVSTQSPLAVYTML